MGTVSELLRVARGELGNKESPAGSNRTKYGKWFGLDGNPWCLMFIMWCFSQIGVSLPKSTASCGDLMRAAQAAGCWVVRDFQPGDVVIYDFSGKRRTTQHCGIVEMELPDYGVQAIEGNTSQGGGSQDNGGMVCRKNRPSKYIVGAVRTRFEAEMKEDEMDINTMISQMTDEQAYKLLEKAKKHAAKLAEPAWSKEEGYWKQLVDAKIFSGAPEDLLRRDELAVVLGRAKLL